MKQVFRNSSGFAAIEAVLVVVVLAIAGGTGLYVYHTKHASDKLLNAAASESADATTPKTKKATSVPTTGSDNASLQTALNGVNSSITQSNQDGTNDNSALNDSQQEVTVPTN
jgi:hypothetical protein